MVFFPQVVVGGGYATSFTLVNTGITRITGNLIITDQQGNPFTVSLTEPGIGSHSAESEYQAANQGSIFPVSLAPGATRFLTADAFDPSDPNKSGWAHLEFYGGSLGGVATFQQTESGVLKTIAGVLSTQPLESATIPVDNSDTENRYTGFAVANPSNRNISIRLVTLDEKGTIVDSLYPEELNPLGPQSQVAKFLHQYLSSRVNFRGSMVLIGEEGKKFVVTALVQNQGLFTAIPVISGKSLILPE
jgi:hypothetical protein